MGDQIQRLQLFFRRKEVDISDDEGDDNSNSEYWEFLNPEEVKAWSIALVPMTDFLHFQAKFRTAEDAMPISGDEKVKDVVWYANNTLFIHCEKTASPPYFFTICLDNSASPFTTLYFLRSLNGSVYEPLMKEVETEIDNKAWQSEDGQPLRARPVAGKVKASTALAITQIPSELESGQEFDYTEIANIYNKFWTECQSCFVFGVEAKYEVHIDQLERAPEDWTVRAYEEHGMQKLRHYLINMPDRSTR